MEKEGPAQGCVARLVSMGEWCSDYRVFEEPWSLMAAHLETKGGKCLSTDLYLLLVKGGITDFNSTAHARPSGCVQMSYTGQRSPRAGAQPCGSIDL